VFSWWAWPFFGLAFRPPLGLGSLLGFFGFFLLFLWPGSPGFLFLPAPSLFFFASGGAFFARFPGSPLAPARLPLLVAFFVLFSLVCEFDTLAFMGCIVSLCETLPFARGLVLGPLRFAFRAQPSGPALLDLLSLLGSPSLVRRLALILYEILYQPRGCEMGFPVLVAFPDRDLEAHIYTAGALGLLVGSVTYPGAAVLACPAAFRSGAGLVFVFSSPAITEVLIKACPDVLFCALDYDSEGVLPPHAFPLFCGGIGRSLLKLFALGSGLADLAASLLFEGVC
jgi:Predicted sugar kinase